MSFKNLVMLSALLLSFIILASMPDIVNLTGASITELIEIETTVTDGFTVTAHLNTTSLGNLTNDNVTLHFSHSNLAPGDAFTPIVHWRRNNISLVSFYAEFDRDDYPSANTTYEYGPNKTLGRLGGLTNGDSSEPTWRGNDSACLSYTGCYEFDGDDDYIIFPASAVRHLPPYSIEFWVLANNATPASNQYIFANGGHTTVATGYSAIVNSSGHITFRINTHVGDIGTDDLGVLNNQKWNHLILTWDGTADTNAIKLYQNGTLVGQTTPESITAAATLQDLTFGVPPTGFIEWVFDGKIDMFREWSIVLTPAQVKLLYNESRDSHTAQDSVVRNISTIDASLTNVSDIFQAEIFVSNTTSTLSFNSTLLNITIDNTPPLIQFEDPTEANASALTSTNIAVNVTATDLLLASLNISLYNSTNSVNSSNSSTSPAYFSFAGLAYGTYYFNATAADTSGNTNSTSTRTVTINATVTSALTPPPQPANGGMGQNRSAASKPPLYPLEISKKEIRIRSHPETFHREEITLKNIGPTPLEITINNLKAVPDLLFETSASIRFSTPSILLDPGKEKKFDAMITSGIKPGAFTAVIEIIYTVPGSGVQSREEIPVIIDIIAANRLFDISSTLAKKKLLAKDKLDVQIDINAIGEAKLEQTATLKYSIKDLKGEVYYENSEEKSIGKQSSFIKSIYLPNLKAGKYILVTELLFANDYSVHTETFEVTGNSLPELKPEYILAALAGLAAIAGIVIMRSQNKNARVKRRRRNRK